MPRVRAMENSLHATGAIIQETGGRKQESHAHQDRPQHAVMRGPISICMCIPIHPILKADGPYVSLHCQRTNLMSTR